MISCSKSKTEEITTSNSISQVIIELTDITVNPNNENEGVIVFSVPNFRELVKIELEKNAADKGFDIISHGIESVKISNFILSHAESSGDYSYTPEKAQRYYDFNKKVDHSKLRFGAANDFKKEIGVACEPATLEEPFPIRVLDFTMFEKEINDQLEKYENFQFQIKTIFNEQPDFSRQFRCQYTITFQAFYHAISND